MKATQTGYFMPPEYKAVIDTTYIYSDRPSIDKHDSLTIGGYRIRALTELMRWTGLRIRDAVTLEKHRLVCDPDSGLWSVMVYQKKTGDPVYCPIPPHVAELLQGVLASQKGNTNERYFFWTGDGLAKRSPPIGNGATRNCSNSPRSRTVGDCRNGVTHTCSGTHSR